FRPLGRLHPLRGPFRRHALQAEQRTSARRGPARCATPRKWRPRAARGSPSGARGHRTTKWKPTPEARPDGSSGHAPCSPPRDMNAFRRAVALALAGAAGITLSCRLDPATGANLVAIPVQAQDTAESLEGCIGLPSAMGSEDQEAT